MNIQPKDIHLYIAIKHIGIEVGVVASQFYGVLGDIQACFRSVVPKAVVTELRFFVIVLPLV